MNDKKTRRRFYVFVLIGLLLWTLATDFKLWVQAAGFVNRGDTQPVKATTVKNNKKEGMRSFDEVVKDTKKLEGLFTLYRNQESSKIYLEIKPEQLNKNYLGIVTMESGIGESGIYSKLPLSDVLFYFRRLNNDLQLLNSLCRQTLFV